METLVQQFIKAFGWSILNSFWQSALIYGLLFIILFGFPKLAARHKHNLAFGSIILMFTCFGYNFIHQILVNIPKQTAAVPIQNIQAYPYFNNLPQGFSSKAEQYFPIIVAFYIIGIILQLFVIVKGYSQLSKLKKEGLSTIPDVWKAIFDGVTAKLKINKKIIFHLSAIANVPLVIGYLKPVVLFPIALVNQLDPDQVEAILIHELSHIRRNDFLLNLIKTAIETLLFFNPFVWMVGRFIDIEREHACDDLVLKITDKPINYAHALLKLELLKDKTSPAYALAATGKTQNLYQRIKRITNMKTNYLNAKQQMAALTLGVACLFSIAWINPAEKKQTEKKTVKESTIQSDINVNNNRIVTYLDTTKKRKIKIVTIDANGKRTEYNSVKEMPDSLKKDFYKDNLSFRGKEMMFYPDSNFHLKFDTAGFVALKNLKMDTATMAQIRRHTLLLKKQFDSPEWKKQQEEMRKKFNSPEWKKQMENMGAEMKKKFESKEFKTQMDSIKVHFKSPEFKAQMDSITIKMSSPEWKKQIQDLGVDMKRKFDSKEFRAQMDDAKKQSIIIRRQMESPEWKAKIQEMKELSNSAEYKKLKEKFDKEVKELKEKMEKKERAEKKEKTEQ